MDYEKIKKSNEYQELLDLGYVDKSTPVQIKNGSLDFSKSPSDPTCEDRYTIYGNKIRNETIWRPSPGEGKTRKRKIQGSIRGYSKISGWGGQSADVKQYRLAKEIDIITYEDYIDAIKKVIELSKKRKNKHWIKIEKMPKVALRTLFESKYKIKSIKDLYDRLNYEA